MRTGVAPAMNGDDGGYSSTVAEDGVGDRLRLAVEVTGIGLCEIDCASGEARLDANAARLFGVPEQRAHALARGDWLANVDPRDRVGLESGLDALARVGAELAMDLRTRGDDEATICLHATGRLLLGGHGEPAQILLVVQDFTQQRQTEAELREVEYRFRLLVENLEDVFWIVDWRSGRQLYASPSYQRIWGFSHEALYAGLPRWPEHIHADDRARVEAAFGALAFAPAGQDQFAVEYRLLMASGEERWIRDRGFAVRDRLGAIERVVGIAEDITDRRTVIRSLRDREQRLQLAIDAAQLHVWTLEPGWRGLQVSDALCALFGLSIARCRRLGPWRRRIDPGGRARFELALRRLIESGEPLHEELRLRRPDGSGSWLDVRAVLGHDDAGRPRVQGVAADITQRKEQEQSLVERERELRTITAAVPIGITRIGRARQYLFVNEAYAEHLLLRPAAEVIGRPVAEVLGETAYAQLAPFIERALAGERLSFETALKLPCGFRYMHLIYVPEADERGAVNSLVGVIEDITERKLAEVKLYQREREFKALAENAPDVIARVDRNLGYLYINRAAESAFSVSRSRYAGSDAAGVGFPLAYVEATERVVAEAFASSREQSTSFAADTGEGLRHYTARAVPERDPRGRLESVLLIIYDVSERVRAQAEREALLEREHSARKLAEAAARARDEFMAIVTHELRSPLNGIQSWAHVLDKRADDARIRERAVAGIKTGVQQQARLISDLLDATRIMTGKLSLNVAPFRVLPTLVAAAESVRHLAAERDIRFESDLRLGEETIDGDGDRVQQVAWNLLSNAIKFTPPGGRVWFSAANEDGQLLLSVRDTGRGIDAGFLPQLFERFQRDETGSNRGQDGLGLGLMLVRHLCALHQGEVRAESAGRGHGATFTVRLPLRSRRAIVAARPDAGTELPLASLSGVTVLIVEDDAESREALKLLLEAVAATTLALGSGEEALQRLADGSLARPDVMVCDIAMPTMDGYQTIRAIRARERRAAAPRLPAIALTAFSQLDDRQRALEAGFDRHLGKPVKIADLILAIAAVMPSRLPVA